ncbi:MAG: competence/damage-inducible protein A, partial [Nitrospinales bacterium]
MFGNESQIRQAEIVVIGNEIISGLTQETNSRAISLRLSEAGLDVSRITVVGDDDGAIQDAARQAMDRVGVVVATGGLGPTHDDITKRALARLFRSGFRKDEKVLAMVENFFRRRGREVPDYSLCQCNVPDQAVILYNEKGTAPGLLFHKDGKKLFALPGIPFEMAYLMEKYVVPAVKVDGKAKIAHRILKTTGITESDLWEKIGSMERLKLKVASLPSPLGVKIRISAFGKEDVTAQLDAAEKFFREKISDYIYGRDDETLEETVGGLLRRRNLK